MSFRPSSHSNICIACHSPLLLLAVLSARLGLQGDMRSSDSIAKGCRAGRRGELLHGIYVDALLSAHENGLLVSYQHELAMRIR